MSKHPPAVREWDAVTAGAILAVICAVSFLVSFEHVVENFRDHGQGHYVDVALGVVNELLLFGMGIEFLRRLRKGGAYLPPLLGLMLGIGVTLWGNLSTVPDRPDFADYAAAAYAGIATLVVALVLKTMHGRKANVSAAPGREPRESSRPGTAAPNPTPAIPTHAAVPPPATPAPVPAWTVPDRNGTPVDPADPAGRPTLAERAAVNSWRVVPVCMTSLPRPVPSRRDTAPRPERNGRARRTTPRPRRQTPTAAADTRPPWVAARYEVLVKAGKPKSTASATAWREWERQQQANSPTADPPAAGVG